jgi:hypothetical protein
LNHHHHVRSVKKTPATENEENSWNSCNSNSDDEYTLNDIRSVVSELEIALSVMRGRKRLMESLVSQAETTLNVERTRMRSVLAKSETDRSNVYEELAKNRTTIATLQVRLQQF